MYAYIPPCDPRRTYRGLTSQSIGYRMSVPTLKELQDAVGGLIQPIDLRTPGISAYVNDEGKFSEMPNKRATIIAHRCQALFPGDWIAGTMIIAGFDPASGETTDLPQEFWSVNAIHHLGHEGIYDGRNNWVERMPDFDKLYEDYFLAQAPDDIPLPR